jgi:hypothetical protein
MKSMVEKEGDEEIVIHDNSIGQISDPDITLSM